MVAKVGGFGSVVVCCQGIDFMGGCRVFFIIRCCYAVGKVL